jgi:tetratricopeptide (TPR) repeat protein
MTKPHEVTSDMVSDGDSKSRATRWGIALAVLVVVGAGAFLIGRWTAPGGDPVVTESERSVGDLLAEAVALHSSGLTDVAIERYDAILVLEPNNALALYNLGQITQQRGSLEESIALYDRALASDPSLASAAFNRAIALRELGREDEAIAGFEAILAEDPDSVGALFNLGNLYIARGEPERGVELVNRAVELDPSLRGD